MGKKQAGIKLSEKILDKDIGVTINVDENSFSNYHCHEFIEVLYCQEGRGKQIVDDEEIGISHGDIFLFNQDVYHRFSGDDGKLRVINIMFRPNLFIGQSSKNFIKDFFASKFREEKNNILKNLKYLCVRGKNSNANYGIQCSSILKEYRYMQPDYLEILYKEIELLMLNMGRDCIIQHKLLGLSMENEQTIQKVIDQINENILTVNTTGDILKDIPYNDAYFNRIFKRYMGISLSKYIKKKKIDYACMLLIGSDLTIECISEKIGYSDVKNFYRVFKESMNQTPGAFRYNINNLK